MSLEQLRVIAGRVSDAAEAYGRDPATVRLIAVSKTFPVQRIEEASTGGHLDFGESYAQELRDKARALPELRWHFIGRLQSNKAKYVAPVAHRVHALETSSQAQALAKRAPPDRRVQCLVSVNIGREPQKSGLLPEAVLDAVPTLAEHVDVVGLFCIPPRGQDPEPHYAALAALAAEGRAAGLPLDELSMGMSRDYDVAIRHGATWVRVGTAIFGSRS